MTTPDPNSMVVQTSRFGTIEVPSDRIITFAHGLLGFSADKNWCLLVGENESFFWLQSATSPSLALVITDPSLHQPNYSVPISPGQMDRLGLRSLDDAQVFAVCNHRNGAVTMNLVGPIVVNTLNRTGEQFVLEGSRYHTAHALVSKGTP